MNTKKTMSPALEDYLETILFLFERNGSVRVTDVAMEMKISKPSVNNAINILKEQGLVCHEHYGLLSLSGEGTKLASSIAARHHAIKWFLKDLLGVPDEAAEEEACRIEHVVSTETVSKLINFIENYTAKNNSSK